MNIYFFQWVSRLGGADTRLRDLIQCFSSRPDFKLFSIPNTNKHFQDQKAMEFYSKYNVTTLKWEELPEKLDGVGISFCNFNLFETDKIKRIKNMGLKFIWSNDMMWKRPEEQNAVQEGLIDALIYTSTQHLADTRYKDIFTPEYIVPNYLHLENYPYIERTRSDLFTIGKHSRPDPKKFSDNFPLFYQNLGLRNPKYRVMGVYEGFKSVRFKWYDFDEKWDLLPAVKEPVVKYLSSLDCYVYNSHISFTETQCRATLEAMLTGLPVVAPNKFNFRQQIRHEDTGFICESYQDFQKYTQFLEKNRKECEEIGIKARHLTQETWCNTQEQIEAWEKIFNDIV